MVFILILTRVSHTVNVDSPFLIATDLVEDILKTLILSGPMYLIFIVGIA